MTRTCKGFRPVVLRLQSVPGPELTANPKTPDKSPFHSEGAYLNKNVSVKQVRHYAITPRLRPNF